MQSPGQTLTFGHMIADPRTSVAFSGHRTYCGDAADALHRTVGELYARGFRTFLSGMAVGFDLAAAEAVLELRGRRPMCRWSPRFPSGDQEARFPQADRERFGRCWPPPMPSRYSLRSITGGVTPSVTIFWSITPGFWWRGTTVRPAARAIPSAAPSAAGWRFWTSIRQLPRCRLPHRRSSDEKRRTRRARLCRWCEFSYSVGSVSSIPWSSSSMRRSVEVLPYSFAG